MRGKMHRLRQLAPGNAIDVMSDDDFAIRWRKTSPDGIRETVKRCRLLPGVLIP